MPDWMDRTPYQDGKPNTDRESWEINLAGGDLRPEVHRFLHLDGWYLTCPSLDVKCALDDKCIDGAKEEAIALIKRALEDMLAGIKEYEDERAE